MYHDMVDEACKLGLFEVQIWGKCLHSINWSRLCSLDYSPLKKISANLEMHDFAV